MRLYRFTFFAGLATGYVLGTRDGKERYEQIKKLARSTAENPTVQQAAGAIQAQATSLLAAAASQFQEQVPKLAHSAMDKAGDHIPGMRHKDGHHSGSDGSSGGDGRPMASTERHNGGRTGKS
jgi:hypothetical protein